MYSQNKIIPSTSTAKQAKTTDFGFVRAKSFTRVHRKPTWRDYQILKEEACAPASKVEDISHTWSKNVTDNYRLLTDILGVNEYDDLTNIATDAIPHKPASYGPTISNAIPVHTRELLHLLKGFLKGIVDHLRDALDE